MNENNLFVVEEYKFDNPLCFDIDSIIDGCFKNCHKNCFHNFEYECIYDIKFTNITDIELINFTNFGTSKNLYDLNKKMKNVRHKGFIFNPISKLTVKFYSHLRYINIGYI